MIIVVHFHEYGFICLPLEDVASVSATPPHVVEPKKSRVDADLRSALPHFVRVAGTHAGDERHPAGEFPPHLDVEVRRLGKSLEQSRHARCSLCKLLTIAMLEAHLHSVVLVDEFAFRQNKIRRQLATVNKNLSCIAVIVLAVLVTITELKFSAALNENVFIIRISLRDAK